MPVGSTGAAGNGSLTDGNVQFYGRWDKDDAAWYQMGWAGGYVETAFSGASIGVKLRGTIDMWYSIDGGAETWMRAVSGNVTVRSGLSGTHTIRIGFRERAGSYTGDPSFGGFILASGGATSSTVRPDKHIEFIGDSITVGQPNANRPFSTYAWNSAEALGASHMQVAEGGACVSTTDCRGMVDWFLRTTNQDANDMWEFNTYETDLVVINLGTNNKVTAAQFQADYILLLQRVRQSYPNAEILAMGVFRERLLRRSRTPSRTATTPVTPRSTTSTPAAGSTRPPTPATTCTRRTPATRRSRACSRRSSTGTSSGAAAARAAARSRAGSSDRAPPFYWVASASVGESREARIAG